MWVGFGGKSERLASNRDGFVYQLNLWNFNMCLRARVASHSTGIGYVIPNAFLTHQNLLYLFYHIILQYIVHQMFYFNITTH